MHAQQDRGQRNGDEEGGNTLRAKKLVECVVALALNGSPMERNAALGALGWMGRDEVFPFVSRILWPSPLLAVFTDSLKNLDVTTRHRALTSLITFTKALKVVPSLLKHCSLLTVLCNAGTEL